MPKPRVHIKPSENRWNKKLEYSPTPALQVAWKVVTENMEVTDFRAAPLSCAFPLLQRGPLSALFSASPHT